MLCFLLLPLHANILQQTCIQLSIGDIWRRTAGAGAGLAAQGWRLLAGMWLVLGRCGRELALISQPHAASGYHHIPAQHNQQMDRERELDLWKLHYYSKKSGIK